MHNYARLSTIIHDLGPFVPFYVFVTKGVTLKMGSCPARHCERNVDTRLFDFHLFSEKNGFPACRRFILLLTFLFENIYIYIYIYI